MSNSTFFNQIGTVGAKIAAQLGPVLGVTLSYSKRGATAISVQGYVPRTAKITKELVLSMLAGVARMTFFIPAQTGFPPNGGVEILDTVAWTPPNASSPVTLTIETINDVGNLNTMFEVTCYLATPRQVGAVGMTN